MPRHPLRPLTLRPLFAILLLGLTSTATASPKPCRNASGRITPCPKPGKAVAKRCKDASGRFVRCDSPHAQQVETGHS